jgi:glycosyltransferase involved in cell wall biosynthesis
MTSTVCQNLALVITELEPGGAERALTQLALRIDRTRFRPFVFSLRAMPPAGKDELVLALKSAEIPVEFLDARHKWQFPSAVWQLKRRLRELKVDIVQSFLFHANVVAAVAAKLAGVRVCAGIRVADPSRQRQRIERWLAPLVERYVCVSQSVADFSANVAGLPRQKLVMIPNGVDVPRFRDAVPADLSTLHLPANRRWLMTVGRLERQKGHDWLLPLLPAVFQAHADYDLIVIGDGPDRQKLEQQTKLLGLVERVHFVGWQSHVPQWLKVADLLLLPSRWEGMPNVLLEAMAAGLPVVATRVEGTEEVLGPLAEEQLAPLDNKVEYVHRLLAQLASPARRKQLGAANQERATTQFSLAVMATAYQELYRSLTNS